MEINAQLRGIRIAPRKVRAVAGVLRGMDVAQAKSQLDHLVKRCAKPIAKLLDSAMANAHNNFGLVKENLFIKDIIVNEGRKLKRGEPKGFGSVSPIEKKTSHIKIILDERVPGMKAEKKKIDEGKMEKKEDTKITAPTREKKTAHIKEDKGIQKKGVFGGIKGLGRRFFRRKAI